MGNLSTWSTTAANNNSAAPDGFPENMAPSGVNDAAREVMAAVRRAFDDGGWHNWGYTHTYAAATQFTIATNLTTTYAVGRRVRAVGSGTGTIYGTISASTYSAPNTTVTVKWDSGSLSSETLTISLSVFDINQKAVLPHTLQNQAHVVALGGGTVDAITATYAPPLQALTNDMMVCVIAAGANTSATPTFAPNGLTAKTIVKLANAALVAGDIPGQYYPCYLVYNSTLDKWTLINPAISTATQAQQEAGTATAAYVAPATQQYHPSAPKAWVRFTVSGGTVTVAASYNVTGVARNAINDFTITFTVAFSDTTYAVVPGFCGIFPSIVIFATPYVITRAVGTCQITMARVSDASQKEAVQETPEVNVMFFGDQ